MDRADPTPTDPVPESPPASEAGIGTEAVPTTGPDGVLAGFHPAVSRWFSETFDEPTPPQRAGWRAIREGRHTLIAAPTGSGKTLAAFLHALDVLLREGIGRASAAPDPEGFAGDLFDGMREGTAPVGGAAPAGGTGNGGAPGSGASGGPAPTPMPPPTSDGPALPDECRVVYVSPLKALSADIHRNLAEPRKEIRRTARRMGLPDVRITAAVRSGDTPQSARRRMVKTPPHILVTTPESLYLLLTSRRGREMLSTVESVVVDEIHAVLESRRGVHLALTLERLEHVAGRPVQRIGLSATQKPIEEVGRFLVGTARVAEDGTPDCTIVDEGHWRESDLGIVVPDSPLEAVMSGEVWEEVYAKLSGLIEAHRTTLVFVNTRRLAERVARDLSERLGEDAVTAHHGSLSKETRLDAERRLKDGELRALVATASLELGIDVGHVDLVCQIGTPNRISTVLQRVGRSGHTVEGTPKGRLFPLTRDDLVQGAALLRAARRGELDRAVPFEDRADILAQQVVAESASEEWEVDALFERFRRAWPYRELTAERFGEVIEMVSGGFRTPRGRRGAMVHHDRVNGRIRGRRGARLWALTSGGAIPDQADFRVVEEPAGTYVGTVDEDFAIESAPGDIFQLGNTSWQVLRVEEGTVRVADAHGQPPTIPFWFGEAPARSDELSRAVSELRREVSERLGEVVAPGNPRRPPAAEGAEGNGSVAAEPAGGEPPAADGLDREAAAGWLVEEVGLSRPAAFQLAHYLADTKRLLGVVPTRESLVLERFFDESGGMQLVLHAPFGNRINKGWGYALRKRFCRGFNFELQAAATEDGLLLSLGPQHSFPLEDVYRFLKPETVEEILTQAFLDAPVFEVRWRWAATLSLAVLRWRGGKKTPPQIQRMESEDLLAAVFPEALACFENIEGGKREIPEHPLVDQAIDDCLREAMDIDGLIRVLERIRAGELELVARDTPEPSPLSHEILNARPYAFLDDAPLEERRARAVYTRRALEPSAAAELGALDADAIERVREEAWPDPRDPDELHDALLTSGFLTEGEGERGRDETSWRGWMETLVADGRAVRLADRRDARRDGDDERKLWLATERVPQVRTLFPDARLEPEPDLPPELAAADPFREDALKELLRGRTEILGPTTTAEAASTLALPEAEVERGLLALEAEGSILRGRFTAEAVREERREWCDRRLLARIHRYTLKRLRAEIEPVSASDFIRFLFQWQRAAPGHWVRGQEGLAAVLEQLDGYELPAAAWEPDVLSLRCEDYEPDFLDALCLTGRIVWGRLSPPNGSGAGSFTSGPLRSSPVALFLREHAEAWLALSPGEEDPEFSTYARLVREALGENGASFFHELVSATGILPTQVERGLGELAARGLATSDSFSGLRALLTPSDRRRPLKDGAGGKGRAGDRRAPYGVETAGRWSVLRPDPAEARAEGAAESRKSGAGGRRGAAVGGDRRAREEAVEAFAAALLRRYGVVFRKLLAREPAAPPWRELILVYRRMEARGEVRGGRFVRGFSGEQFAHPEAVGRLRAVRKEEPSGQLFSVSAADPLNLVGVLTPGDRIPALATNRVVFRDGVPVASHEGGDTRTLVHEEAPDERDIRRALVRKVAPSLRWYVGRAG